MKNATLYFHYPCFDGIVSAVLAWEYLEKKGWNITSLAPVNYNQSGKWWSRQLKRPCAVVDFLYHPRADFWADHHQTSFSTPRARASYERRKRKRKNALFYDDQAASCAGLLYRSLRTFFNDKPHFRELVAWAQKIDSAAYSSVKEAILGSAPALQINRTLMLDKESGAKYARFLVRELRDHHLKRVADLEEVRWREKRALGSIKKGLQRAKKMARHEEGEIVIVDARRRSNQMISRYAPYDVSPNARYSIGIVRSPGRIGITAMRNPWRKFPSIAVGRALQEFGGGGHWRVGAVGLPAREHRKAAAVVKSLLSKMRAR